MQQQLKIITDYLGYKNIGTHSFRKLFAHTLYEESGHDIELVRHVSVSYTHLNSHSYISIRN